MADISYPDLWLESSDKLDAADIVDDASGATLYYACIKTLPKHRGFAVVALENKRGTGLDDERLLFKSGDFDEAADYWKSFKRKSDSEILKLVSKARKGRVI